MINISLYWHRFSQMFWTASILTMYQPQSWEDYDPDILFDFLAGQPVENESGEVCLGLYHEKLININNNVAMIFLETIRDYNVVQTFLSKPYPQKYHPVHVAILMTHELGHTGGLLDDEGGDYGN
jgi:hypothetical protein